MRKLKTKTLLIAVAVVALAWYLLAPVHDEAAGELVYQTQALSTGTIESVVNASGTISPVVTVEVGSEVSGLISELYADFNDEVKKDQVIARINDNTIRQRLKQAEANIATAKASLAQSQASLKKQQTELQLTRQEFERQKTLFDKKLVSESAFQQAETKLRVTEADIDVAKAQLNSSEANLRQVEAQHEQVKLDLQRTYIRSPVDGVVIDRSVNIGQTVAANFSAPTLFKIAQDLSQMQIEADIDEADIGRVQQSQTARFTVDAFPDRKFNGQVSQVRKASTVTNNVVTYKVIISVRNEDEVLLPGMTANVDLTVGQKSDVLRVANSALRFRPADSAENSSDNSRGGGMTAAMEARMAKLKESLQLSESQAREFQEAFNDMIKEMQPPENNTPGQTPTFSFVRRQQMQAARQRLDNRLKSILSDEQFAKFQEQSQQFRTGGNDYKSATVWVLKDGEPQAVRVRIGLADSEYTELISDQLKNGDPVIVRAQRKQP